MMSVGIYTVSGDFGLLPRFIRGEGVLKTFDGSRQRYQLARGSAYGNIIIPSGPSNIWCHSTLRKPRGIAEVSQYENTVTRPRFFGQQSMRL